MTSKRQPVNAGREAKLLFIGRAHLAPGMSLAKWREIVLEKHGVPADGKGDAWQGIPETTLDAIIAEISAITAQAWEEVQP